MASARVSLHGRFKPGQQVRLVKVRDERALRAEGGEEVGSQKVDKDGRVSFTSGVEVGARYFIVGQVDGEHVEVRARGRAADDPSTVLENAQVQPDRVRLSDGSWADEAPERREVPPFDVGPAPSQDQVPKGTVQRSDTPRGTAHPVDVKDQEPVRRQEDVNGPVQMSDTETGEATEIVGSKSRQEDVNGVLQRSDTPHGVATPFPKGDAIKAQQEQESSRARESRGDRTQAAAAPLDTPKAKAGVRAEASGDQPADQVADTSGHDALGQPAADDVAKAAGVEPAAKAREAKKRKRSSSRKGSARKATTAKTSAKPAARKGKK